MYCISWFVRSVGGESGRGRGCASKGAAAVSDLCPIGGHILPASLISGFFVTLLILYGSVLVILE